MQTDKPETPLPKQCLAFSLRKAMRLVGQIYDEALRPVDLKASQYNVLVAIAWNEPVAQKSLADRLGMDKTTLTRNLGPLERRGLIAVKPGADKRVREISISAKGRKLMTAAFPLWQAAQDAIGRRLGRDGLDNLIETVARATEGLPPPSQP